MFRPFVFRCVKEGSASDVPLVRFVPVWYNSPNPEPTTLDLSTVAVLDGIHRKRHHRSRRARAGSPPARHVHRRRRRHRPASPGLGNPRQLHRRGDERPRLERLGDASQGRLVDHDRRRWAGDSDRQAPDHQEERARGDFHRAARRREIRSRQLQDGRRSARRRRERGQCAVERAGGHGSARRRGMGAALQAGQSAGSAEENRPGARQRHEGFFSAPTRRSFRRWSSTPPSSASASKWPAISTKGLKISFEDESDKTKVTFEHADGMLAYLKKILAERGAKPVHEAAFTLEKQNGLRLDLVLQWTESTEEHIRSYVNGIPTGVGRHARKRAARGPGQGDAQLHRHAQPVAQGRDDHRRRHSRRADGRAERVHPGAAVSGADQGSAEQPRGAVGRRLAGAAGPGALAEPQHQRGRSDRRAHHPGGPRARGQPRGVGRK